MDARIAALAEAEGLHQRGKAAVEAKDYSTGEALFLKATELAPNQDRYRHSYGTALWWQGKNFEALAQYRRAVEIAADHGEYDRIAFYFGTMRQVAAVTSDADNRARTRISSAPTDPTKAAVFAAVNAKVQEANAQWQAGELASAEAIYQQLVQPAESSLGAAHGITISVYYALGNLAAYQGNHSGAASRLLQAYESAKAALGDRHPDTLAYAGQLAAAERAAGRLDEARDRLVPVVVNATRALGKDHAATLLYRQYLGEVAADLGRSEEALRSLEEVWNGRRRLYGPGHPDGLQTLLAVAGLRAKVGDVEGAKRAWADGFRFASEFLDGGDLVNAFYSEASTAYGYPEFTASRTPAMFIAEVLRPAHPQRIAVAREEASRLIDENRFAEARTRYEACLRAVIDELGRESYRVATIEEDIGSLEVRVGALADGRERLERAYASLRLTVGERHRSTLRVMSALSVTMQKMGQYSDAVAWAERTYGTAEGFFEPDDPALLELANTLALAYNSAGRWRDAGALYEKNFADRTRVLGAEHSETLRSKFNLGMFLSGRGEFGRAETLLAETLTARRRLFGDAHQDTLRSMEAMGTVRYLKGDFSAAQGLYEEVLEQRTKTLGEGHRETLGTLNALAGLYMAQGKPLWARPFFERSVNQHQRHLGDEHPWTMVARNDYANLLRGLGEYKEALALYEKNLRLAENRLPTTHEVVITGRINRALTIGDLGDVPRQGALLEELYAVCVHEFGELHPTTLNVLGSLAVVVSDLGDNERALVLSEKALDEKERTLGPNHPDTLLALLNLAELLRQRGDFDRSLAAWDDSLTRSTEFLETILWTADERTRLGYLSRQLPARAMTFDLLRTLRTPDAARLLARWSLTRKNLLIRISAEIQAAARASANEELRADAERLRSLRAELAELNLSGTADDRDRVTGIERELQDLERRLGATIRAFRRAQEEPTVDGLHQALGAGEALVDFFVYWSSDSDGYRLLGLVVANGAGRIVDLGETAALKDKVSTLRRAWVGGDSADELATELYRSIWSPLGLRDAKQVYLVPDEFLHLLPFAALRDETGEYLIERTELRLLASARELLLPSESSDASGSVLGINPSFDAPLKAKGRVRGTRYTDLLFTPLPGTRLEGRRIAALMRKRGMKPTVLSGRRLSEGEVLKVVRPKILHLATHGFFLDSELPSVDDGRGLVLQYRPPKKASAPKLASEADKRGPAESSYPLLRTGLALTGANRGVEGRGRRDGDDGILTAMEVLAMDLQGTELVVLSACETGLGTRYEGQGVAGLRSAFQEAGARAVLATLWSVDDAATQRFMVEFYRRILDGVEPAVALREVQQVFIDDNLSPYYWAPFVLAGV
ncbi:MAG: tetratricopeptide repeat protein [Myxococcota bacterium]